MKTINSYEELDQIRKGLDDAVINDTFTADLLRDAIDSVDTAGYETIPGSVGMNWLWHNQHNIYEASEDPEVELYRVYLRAMISAAIENSLGNPYITGVLCNAELFGLIAPDERELFMKEVIDLHNPHHNWVQTVIDAGVSQEAVADTVLAKLQFTSTEVLGCGMANFMEHDFLEYGAGAVVNGMLASELTLWSVLSDEQLIEAVQICIGKLPNLLFYSHGPGRTSVVEKLRMRLSPEQLKALQEEAASKLESLDRISLDELDKLPLTTRLEVAERVKGGSLEFIIRLALALGFKDGGKELCGKYAELFVTDGNSAANYRRFYDMLQRAENKVMAGHIELKLQQQYRADGYVLGQIKEGNFRDRHAQRDRKQMQVVHKGITYVQDRSQHRYFPKVGDWVLFKPSSGRQLTPRVTAVIFMPAHNNKDFM